MSREHLRPLSPAKRIAQLEGMLNTALTELDHVKAVLSDLLQEKGLPHDVLEKYLEEAMPYVFDPFSAIRPRYWDLMRRPTISSSQNDDLKYDDGEFRLWVTREPEARTVTVESYADGRRWTTIEQYEG